MKKRKGILMAAILVLAGVIVGLGISLTLNIQDSAHSQESSISKEAVEILTRTNEAMAEVSAAVKPAVVNISTTRTIKMQGFQHPFFDDPMFRRFFGDEFGGPGGKGRPREHKKASLGSGVIVDKGGYILTNNHVVKDADEIRIKLSDKREFKGKVVGSDAKTDLAVIKIDSNHLPVVKWGDSDKLKVGETVLAVGNPYGLNQTVTSGIVSATGRANVGIADYEDFIQTDAAINPGNSGGALINIRGELVGINTAIFSTSGGYQGIGFAIPSNMVRAIMESLIKSGKVVRGWLGVSIQPITAELAKQFGLKEEKGALIGDVMENSPAEKAGLQRGDIITEFDGRPVDDPAALRNMAATTAPGKTVAVSVLHEGTRKTVQVTIGELPASMPKMTGDYDNLLKGVQVGDLTPQIRKGLGVAKKVSGVVVTSVAEGSPAEDALLSNDIIIEVNKRKVSSVKEYQSLISKIKAGDDILLLIFRNGATSYLTLTAR